METLQPSGQPDFNLTDFVNIKSLLELASRRGAFTAQEMSSVGRVFDRLENFVNFNLAMQKAAAEAEQRRAEEAAKAEKSTVQLVDE